jgi:hypothetical protein
LALWLPSRLLAAQQLCLAWLWPLVEHKLPSRPHRLQLAVGSTPARWPPPQCSRPSCLPLCAASRPSVLHVRPLPLPLALRPRLALLWARQWHPVHQSVLLPLRQKSNPLPCLSRHRLQRLPQLSL